MRVAKPKEPSRKDTGRNDLVVALLNAGCDLTGFAFSRDDQVERAFVQWECRGRPKGAALFIENGENGHESIRVETWK